VLVPLEARVLNLLFLLAELPVLVVAVLAVAEALLAAAPQAVMALLVEVMAVAAVPAAAERKSAMVETARRARSSLPIPSQVAGICFWFSKFCN
jgi:hypothetical protein